MNNNTCPYCGSRLEGVQVAKDVKILCEFCQMFVIPSANGKRSPRKRLDGVSYDHVRMSTPELMELHTFDLLLLLQFVREEKRKYFANMRVIKIAANDHDEFKEVDDEASAEYEMIKRKTFVCENIILDRMGYIPKKITGNLLENYYARCLDSNNLKPMEIKRKGIQ